MIYNNPTKKPPVATADSGSERSKSEINLLRPDIDFSDESIENFIRFAETLRKINDRLFMEGYTMEGGVLKPPENKPL